MKLLPEAVNEQVNYLAKCYIEGVGEKFESLKSVAMNFNHSVKTYDVENISIKD